MPTPPSARERLQTQLAALVDKFERNHNDYMRADYSEADTRGNLVDPLFEALGWDMRDTPGKGAEREVMRERSEKAGRSDYRFRAEGRTLFFVEAKKPHAPLDDRVVLQAKKYAWSNSDEFIYFTVVTNFRELALYDASRKPDPKHPSQGQIFELSYKQYLSDYGLEKLSLLARAAVPASLDKLIKPSQRAARERIQREINVTDEQIDALVYELYGLTKEEIKIVEGT